MVSFRKVVFLKKIFCDLFSADKVFKTRNFHGFVSWKVHKHMAMTMIYDKTTAKFYACGAPLRANLPFEDNVSVRTWCSICVQQLSLRFQKSSWFYSSSLGKWQTNAPFPGLSKQQVFGLKQIENTLVIIESAHWPGKYSKCLLLQLNFPTLHSFRAKLKIKIYALEENDIFKFEKLVLLWNCWIIDKILQRYTKTDVFRTLSTIYGGVLLRK